MKISVLGATGSTGNLVVKMLLEQNHDVVAFIRDPAKLDLTDVDFAEAKLTIVGGELYDRVLMKKAIDGSDALISCLGSSTTASSDELTLMAASVTHVLKETSIPKVVYLSTAGIEDEFEGFTKWLIHMVIGNVIADHKKAAKLYQKCGLTYVIARPLKLTNKKPTFKYHMAEEGLPKSKKGISRANVADFLVKAATTDQFDNKSMALSE